MRGVTPELHTASRRIPDSRTAWSPESTQHQRASHHER